MDPQRGNNVQGRSTTRHCMVSLSCNVRKSCQSTPLGSLGHHLSLLPVMDTGAGNTRGWIQAVQASLGAKRQKQNALLLEEAAPLLHSQRLTGWALCSQVL